MDKQVQCDLEIQEELNSDLLERAMRGDETRLVQLIEELDADVTATDSFGQTVRKYTKNLFPVSKSMTGLCISCQKKLMNMHMVVGNNWFDISMWSTAPEPHNCG